MADFKVFNDGVTHILNTGLKGAAKVALCTKTAEEFVATEKLSAGAAPSEITGTGYAQQEDATPTVSGSEVKLKQLEWKTETHKWIASTTKSAALIVESTLIAVWNLQAGGAARDLSTENTTEKFTGTIKLS